MMEPFPDEWELLSLFESEPTIAEHGVPWTYNTLTFETERGADFVRCVIQPGYETLTVSWWHKGNEKLALDLNWVTGLRVVTGVGVDYLVAKFRDQYVCDLEFHLKPVIKLRWATSTECPPQLNL
jgi:hypothetical protein